MGWGIKVIDPNVNMLYPVKNMSFSGLVKQLIKNNETVWPEEVWLLLDGLLTVDKYERITAKEALKLPLFSSYVPSGATQRENQAFPLYLLSSKRMIDFQLIHPSPTPPNPK